MKKIFQSVKFDNLLKSKVVLWLLFVIALANMYAYLMSSNELYIAYMLLMGFIVSFFSKNMVVILFFSIFVPNMLRFIMEWRDLQEGLVRNSREGLTNKEDSDSTPVESTPAEQLKLKASAVKMNDMKDIIRKAIDKTDQIEDSVKRSETKALLELEGNVLDQLQMIGNMISKNGSGQLDESSDKPSESSKSDD